MPEPPQPATTQPPPTVPPAAVAPPSAADEGAKAVGWALRAFNMAGPRTKVAMLVLGLLGGMETGRAYGLLGGSAAAPDLEPRVAATERAQSELEEDMADLTEGLCIVICALKTEADLACKRCTARQLRR